MSMEKNRIRPIAGTKVMRMSYSRQKEVLEMPNLIEVQKDSYQWFLDEGLKEVFDDISPIADYSGALSLEFVDFELCKDDLQFGRVEPVVADDRAFAVQQIRKDHLGCQIGIHDPPARHKLIPKIREVCCGHP